MRRIANEVSLASKLQRCDREIAEALLAADCADYTLKEKLGILLWELDWRSERESIIEDAIVQDQARR
jgi:hypothetical protein